MAGERDGLSTSPRHWFGGKKGLEGNSVSRSAPELKAVFGGIFAERHRLSAECCREIGYRYPVPERDAECPGLGVCERPDIAVNEAKTVRARCEDRKSTRLNSSH